MTKLLDHIRNKINSSGPLPLEDYMELCLAHPEYGYYPTRDPLGASGDFVTAPEISQMFGEIVGAWCANIWLTLNRPDPFLLVELGPGRGTLMSDMLRTAGQLPGFATAARICLVETSPVLIARQKEKLLPITENIRWFENIDELPEGPAIVVANEFFDALPIRQLIRIGDRWQERAVGLDDTGSLKWTHLDGNDLEPLVAPDLRASEAETIVEVAPVRSGAVTQIANRYGEHPGATLIIDYGYSGPQAGDSFQAVRNHAYTNPLADPGAGDLTTHVDFNGLAHAASAAGANAYSPMPQGAFLESLGIGPRADQLREANPDNKSGIDIDLARLVSPDQMGALFKVLMFTSPDLPPPPPYGEA